MRKTTSVNQYRLPIEVVRDGEGYLASCPNWPDCYAQGDMVDEAVSEISAVATGLIELYQEENKQIPLKFGGIYFPSQHFRLPRNMVERANQKDLCHSSSP